MIRDLKPSLTHRNSIEHPPPQRTSSPRREHSSLATGAETEEINEAHPLMGARVPPNKDVANYYDGGDNDDPTVQALEISISYGIFFILGTNRIILPLCSLCYLHREYADHCDVQSIDAMESCYTGACVLLPWNALIVASHYLRLRLTGSLFESSFASWLPVSYTVSNLVFLGIANSTQQRVSLEHT